jgi:hypothetical protein
MFKAIIAGLGFVLIAGTAGASDANPFMSLTQITVQLAIGLGMFVYGISDKLFEKSY